LGFSASRPVSKRWGFGSLVVHGTLQFALSHSSRKSLTTHLSGHLRCRLIPALASTSSPCTHLMPLRKLRIGMPAHKASLHLAKHSPCFKRAGLPVLEIEKLVYGLRFLHGIRAQSQTAIPGFPTTKNSPPEFLRVPWPLLAASSPVIPRSAIRWVLWQKCFPGPSAQKMKHTGVALAKTSSYALRRLRHRV